MDIIEYTEFLVKNLVKNPDMVKVKLFESDDESPILEIIVHSDDMGAIIGRGGKMATSIRTVIQTFALLKNMPKVRVNIDSF